MRNDFILNFVFVSTILTFILVYGVEIDSRKILSSSYIQGINKKQKDWLAGRNFHKNSELKNLINVSQFRRNFKVDLKDIPKIKDIPKTFDARDRWQNCYSIKSVKAQGNCGSSYAVVPASVFTDRLCIQKNIYRNSSSDQILSCCRKCGGGCYGGHIEKSFIYLKDVGLVTGGDYGSKEGCRPYKINRCPLKNSQPLCGRIRKMTPSCYLLKCSNDRYNNATYDKDKLKFKNIYLVPPSVNLIKSEILKNGPVSASLTVYEDFFHYKNGIYHHVIGSKLGKQDVKLIGWGKSNQKKPYWLAVNSWGKEWGDKGAFKILLGVNECDIESNILAGTFLK